ncbi:hypothetical protein [Variovorax sp. RCC_210]|uniref:hypothetical protein n=1 Tax=Variovorax sp. RCC_210 TaxID=3239217 RepID=UPI0035246C4A
MAFDILRLENIDCMARPQAERRLLWEALLAGPEPPLRLTPMTTDLALALRWPQHFEGAGLDDVLVKPAEVAVPAWQACDVQGQALRTADAVAWRGKILPRLPKTAHGVRTVGP